MIKVLKLVTGEELIGELDIINGFHIVKDPCVLTMVPSRTNPQQPAMAMIPYAAYVKDNKVKIGSNFVMWCEEPVKDLYNQYNSVFGSGIVVAGATAFN